MTEAERIDYIIRHLEGGNTAEFGKRIGLTRATALKMRKGEIGFRLNINRILEEYPQVNRSWLETGEGYPGDLTVDLVKAHYEEKIAKADKVIDHLMRRIDDLEKQIETFSGR